MVDVLVGGKKREDVLREHKSRLEDRVQESQNGGRAAPGPFTFNGIEIETLAYRAEGTDKKMLMDYQESLERLKKAGYQRHVLPKEFITLLDFEQTHSKQEPYREIVNDLLTLGGEWTNLAALSRSDCLQFMENPYYRDPLECCWWGPVKQFDPHGLLATGAPIPLESLPNKIIDYLFETPFRELPLIISQGTIQIANTPGPLGFHFNDSGDGISIELTNFTQVADQQYKPLFGSRGCRTQVIWGEP